MVDVVLELALVNDVVDLLANTLNSAIESNLADDELVGSGLSKLQRLVNWLRAVGNDLLKFQRAEF